MRLTENQISIVVQTRAYLRSGVAREVREKAGFSLNQVASTVGVAPISLSEWERGKRTPRVGPALLIYAGILKALLAAVDKKEVGKGGARSAE